jgi:hypothetical protein
MDNYLEAVVDQLRRCKFVDEKGHPIENNLAFINLMNISPHAIVLANPKVANNEYTSKFVGVLNEMLHLARGAKTSDYAETWNKLGLNGLYVKIMIKEGRLHELIWMNKDPEVKGESVRDTLLDIGCYAVYSVLALDESNINGVGQKKQYYLEMLAELQKRIENMEE